MIYDDLVNASAATLLLASQTPASIVPAIMASPTDRDGQGQACDDAQQSEHAPLTLRAGGAATLPTSSDQAEPESNLPPSQVDAQWYARYNTPEGKRLWFAWTPHYLAAWYNERHSVDELLPGERNGYGLASWRGERTASVAKDGERWADFGASARQPDGSPDTGDALELLARLNGETTNHKPRTLSQVGGECQREACQALERAALSGKPLPAWVEQIIALAGRAHYKQLCNHAQVKESRTLKLEQATRTEPKSAQGGLTGFSPPDQKPPTSSKMQTGDDERQRRNSSSAVSSPSGLLDTPQALAVEIGAEIDEPCQRCGCTLSYQSETFKMCHQCYPRPAKYGRLDDEQRARLKTLFPRK